MFNLFNARASHFMPLMSVIALSALRLFGFSYNFNGGGGIFLMGFFSSAIDGLKTVITAIGAGIGVWGVINLLEGYDRVTKQLSDTTVYLAAIEVLEHNRKELNRMLENESHIVRNISKQKEIYPKVKFLSYYSDNNTINLIGIILNLLDEIFLLI